MRTIVDIAMIAVLLSLSSKSLLRQWNWDQPSIKMSSLFHVPSQSTLAIHRRAARRFPSPQL